MRQDPFGDLNDWGSVLEVFDDLADNGKLAECQPGLIRILQYKGNWQLREEVLKRVGEIQTPSDEMIFQVLAILTDDNIYYDARILAGDGLIQLLKSDRNRFCGEINKELLKITERLRNIPQPAFFDKALKRLYSEVDLPSIFEN